MKLINLSTYSDPYLNKMDPVHCLVPLAVRYVVGVPKALCAAAGVGVHHLLNIHLVYTTMTGVYIVP